MSRMRSNLAVQNRAQLNRCGHLLVAEAVGADRMDDDLRLALRAQPRRGFLYCHRSRCCYGTPSPAPARQPATTPAQSKMPPTGWSLSASWMRAARGQRWKELFRPPPQYNRLFPSPCKGEDEGEGPDAARDFSARDSRFRLCEPSCKDLVNSENQRQLALTVCVVILI